MTSLREGLGSLADEGTTDDTSAEEWRPVPGLPGYEVSNLARARSVKRPRPRLLKVSPGPCGLNTIHLRTPRGASRMYRLGTLILLAFVGPRPRELRVRHLDGNPINDRIENLTYGTEAEVAADHVARARREEAAGGPTHCPEGHRYADSWFGNWGDRMCSPCAWAELALHKDTEPRATECADCGAAFPPSHVRRVRCDPCDEAKQLEYAREYQSRRRRKLKDERAKNPPVTLCKDCAAAIPFREQPGPRPTRCKECAREAQRAADRRHRERKKAARG